MILETRSFVPSGIKEKQQEVELCLRQPYGTILHDVRQGTNLDVHDANIIMIKTDILATLKNVEGIMNTTVSVTAEDGEAVANVFFTYNGEKSSVQIELGGNVNGIV